MPRPNILPAIALGTFVVIAPSFAQDPGSVPLTPQDEYMVLDALGHQLVLPMPDWLTQDTSSEELLDRVSATFEADGGQAHLEIYPRGESEAFWSELYGARIMSPSATALPDLRDVIIDVYGRACRPETIALFQLEPDAGEEIPPLGFVCGAYRDLPGYAGQGEVMIMGFYRSPKGIAVVYQEWRGEAFDAADASTWPVSAEEIEQRAAQFKSEAVLTQAD